MRTDVDFYHLKDDNVNDRDSDRYSLRLKRIIVYCFPKNMVN